MHEWLRANTIRPPGRTCACPFQTAGRLRPEPGVGDRHQRLWSRRPILADRGDALGRTALPASPALKRGEGGGQPIESGHRRGRLGQDGDVEGALARSDQSPKLDPIPEISEKARNSLCWHEACGDKQLAFCLPMNKGLPWRHTLTTSGIVAVLTAGFEGAIDDFQFFGLAQASEPIRAWQPRLLGAGCRTGSGPLSVRRRCFGGHPPRVMK